jgi:hypothetical protein
LYCFREEAWEQLGGKPMSVPELSMAKGMGKARNYEILEEGLNDDFTYLHRISVYAYSSNWE